MEATYKVKIKQSQIIKWQETTNNKFERLPVIIFQKEEIYLVQAQNYKD